MNNRSIALGTVIILIVVVGACWYWFENLRIKPQVQSVPQSTAVAATSTLGGSIYNKVEAEANPAKNVPETNPLQKAVNPFDKTYQNPFGK